MQTWSWLLAAALLACSASARPDGRPEDAVEALAQPQQAPAPAPALSPAPAPADLPRVEVVTAQPELQPDAKPAEVIPDEPKIENEEKPSPVPIEPGVQNPDDSNVYPEGGSLRSPGPRGQQEEAPGTRTARTYLPAEARGAEAEADLEPPRLQWSPDSLDGDGLGSLGRVLAGLRQAQLSQSPSRRSSASSLGGAYSGLGFGYHGSNAYSGAGAGPGSSGAWSWSGSSGLAGLGGLGAAAVTDDSSGPSASYQLFSERELPDELPYYNFPFSNLGKVEVQRRTTPLVRVQPQQPQQPQQLQWHQQAPWQQDQYEYQPPQQQQLYLDGYGFEQPQTPQAYETFSPFRRQYQQQPQSRPVVFSGPPAPHATAGQYGLLDAHDEDYEDALPPYKSILATLEGDQFDAALAYGAVPDPQHEPRPYGYGGALPALPALPSLPLQPYPALPAADSFLSSPFGTFVPAGAQPSQAAQKHHQDEVPVETRSEHPSAAPAMSSATTVAEATTLPPVEAPASTALPEQALPTFDEIQGLPSGAPAAPVEPKPLSEDPTEDLDEALEEENQSDSIPDIYMSEAQTAAPDDLEEAITADSVTATVEDPTPSDTVGPVKSSDVTKAAEDKPTRLLIKPLAKAEAGENGIAIALPISNAVVRGDHPVIVDYDPEVSAVAGANGMAHAMGELILTYVNVTVPPATPTSTSTAPPTLPVEAAAPTTTTAAPASPATTPSDSKALPTTSEATSDVSSSAPPATSTRAPTTKAPTTPAKKQGTKKKQ